MSDSLQQAVGDVLEYLLALQRDGVRPEEARKRLQAVRTAHPEWMLDLLSEVESVDHSVHYDVLVRRDGEGTVSMSYCEDRAVPWPMRGVHRWRESDLVRVNGIVLQVDQAIGCLDFMWDESPIIERLINLCLIEQELKREPIDLTDEELQAAMNRFRSSKELFKAEDTVRWLERHGLSQEKLERYLSDNVLLGKLRERIAGSQVEDYFRQHADELATAQVARLVVATEKQANELAPLIRNGQLDFYAAAAQCHLEASPGELPNPGLFFSVTRHEVEPELRQTLFESQPGQLLGPVRHAQKYALILVQRIRPAVLDDSMRAIIKDILFEAWLAERRESARIEWFWGNASKTG